LRQRRREHACERSTPALEGWSPAGGVPAPGRRGSRQSTASTPRTRSRLRLSLLGFVVVFAATVLPWRAGAQQAADGRDEVTLSLARALEARVTVWRTPTGNAVHVNHCRTTRDGCRARIVAFARWIVDVAREHLIDPFVLAAMAVRESGLDPFAMGPAGELGLLQLHPQGIGHAARFVRSEGYRTRCRREPGACQREVLEIGASHLREAIDHCGSLEAGLGAYNSGECRETAYTRRVMRERAGLLDLAKGQPSTEAAAHDVD